MPDSPPRSDGPPPGWLIDPEDASNWRWWDGHHWTDHHAPRQAGPPKGPPRWPAPSRRLTLPVVLVLAAVAVGAVGVWAAVARSALDGSYEVSWDDPVGPATGECFRGGPTSEATAIASLGGVEFESDPMFWSVFADLCTEEWEARQPRMNTLGVVQGISAVTVIVLVGLAWGLHSRDGDTSPSDAPTPVIRGGALRRLPLPEQREAGWKDDPSAPGARQRHWDGYRWSEAVRPVSPGSDDPSSV